MNELAVRPTNGGEMILSGNTSLSNPPIDVRLVLALFGLKENDPQVHAMLAICDRYGLDPILKHVQLLNFSGKPTIYITRDGLLHVAHKHDAFDGIKAWVTEESDTHYIATCQVWRKDKSHVFEYPGRYPKNGGNAKFAPEMAIKVAECMTLRRAFNIAVPTAEERWDMEEAAPAPARPTPVRQITTARNEPTPAAPVEIDPALRAAMQGFGARAIALGWDVLNPDTGKQLHKKRRGLLIDVTDRGYSEEQLADPQTWLDAIPRIPPHRSLQSAPDQDYAEEDNSEPLGDSSLPNINHADAPRCSVAGCANALTPSQAVMSVDKFGKALCIPHQKDAKTLAQRAKEQPQPTLEAVPAAMEDTHENRTQLINDCGALAATLELLDDTLPIKNQKAQLLAIIADINGVPGYSIAGKQFPTVNEIQKAIAGLPDYAKSKGN